MLANRAVRNTSPYSRTSAWAAELLVMVIHGAHNTPSLAESWSQNFFSQF